MQDLDALNSQAARIAREEAGHVAWPVVWLAAICVLGTAAVLGGYALGLLPLWVCLPLYAVLVYFAYSPVHEAVHVNISGQNRDLRWLNDLCGYLCAQLVLITYSAHRVEHLVHHRNTNIAGRDPDSMLGEAMGGGPLRTAWVYLKFMVMQYVYLPVHAWGNATRRDRLTYLAEISVALGWRIAFVATVGLGPGLALLLGAYLVGIFFLVHWFAFRPHVPYSDPARYRNTNILLLPRGLKWIEWFWLGQNYHGIHHLYPRVPFYRYRPLFEKVRPTLEAHGTDVVGIFDRQPAPDARATA